MSDQDEPTPTEVYVSKEWVYEHIRRALSEALSVEVQHFSIGFSYNSASRGSGVGALGSNDAALHELNPIRISEMIAEHRIKAGVTLLKPPPLTLVKP